MRTKRTLKKTFPHSMSTHTQVGSICDKGANVMEVTISHPSINTFENLRQIHFAIQKNIVCNVRQIHTLSSVMIVNTRWSTLQSNQKRFHQTNPPPLDGSPQCGSTSGLGSNKVNPPPKSDRGHCLWTTV